MSVLSLDSLIDSINRKDESNQMTKQASAVDATTELEQALSINAGEDNTMNVS